MGTFTQCEFPQLLCSGSGQSVVKTGDGGSKDFVFGTELEFLGLIVVVVIVEFSGGFSKLGLGEVRGNQGGKGDLVVVVLSNTGSEKK